jgi:hypothetical protein
MSKPKTPWGNLFDVVIDMGRNTPQMKFRVDARTIHYAGDAAKREARKQVPGSRNSDFRVFSIKSVQA